MKPKEIMTPLQSAQAYLLDVTLKNCDALLILHYALGGGR
jgi:hypothetical protein